MITIGICDDDEYIVRILKEKIESCMNNFSVDTEYLLFFSGEALISCDKQIDLLFLDIEMSGMDGIEAGKCFRARNRDCKIVMATVRSERMREAFFLEAYRFLIKPFADIEVKEVIDSFMESRIGFQKLVLFENRRQVEVYQYQVIYIQTYDSYTEFIVDHRVLRSERSLKGLEKELDTRLFFRVDKKFIVNFKYIDSFEKGMISIAGKEIKVARRRIHAFEESYREYDLRYW